MPTVKEQISMALGANCTRISNMGGGCIGEVYEAALEDGRRVVAKVDSGKKPKLDIEGYMLQYLRAHSGLPVPEVFHSAPELLVMEYLDGDSRFSPAAEKDAAEKVAALHAIKPSDAGLDDRFGLERDTLIGSLHQPNPWTDGWLDFFRQHRLLYMASVAAKSGSLPSDVHKRIQQFAEKLDELLLEPPHPSLLHGDMWTTNILASGGRITGFIDPAVYYGHPEIELAFSTLFGAFGRNFFERYNEIRPIPDGFFDTRRDIYNLYPLLVHVTLFGSGYLGGIESTLRRHGC